MLLTIPLCKVHSCGVRTLRFLVLVSDFGRRFSVCFSACRIYLYDEATTARHLEPQNTEVEYGRRVFNQVLRTIISAPLQYYEQQIHTFLVNCVTHCSESHIFILLEFQNLHETRGISSAHVGSQ